MYASFLPARQASLRLFVLLVTLLLAGPGRGWAQAPAWAQAVSLNPSGGGGTSDCRAVATDAAGNQYVTGIFGGTLVLGSTTLVSAGGNDIFIAKRSAATGAWLWAVRAGGSGNDGAGYKMGVDAGGNALVTGYFTNTASFGSSPAAIALTSAGGYDVFVAKFGAATGACTWAVRAGGSGNDLGSGMTVDAGGNALVTGSFSGTASFGTSPAPTALVATALSGDAFVAKFGAATGVCAWAVGAGGSSGGAVGNGVAVDAGGNALVIGTFFGTASFGTSPAAIVLTSAGSTDAFVAKFGAATGACAWAVGAGGSGGDAGYGMAVDAGGNALVTGSFLGTASFGTSPVPTALVATGQSGDVFVAKFRAATGACAWAVGAGGSGGADSGIGVAVDAGGNALVTGSFQGTITFATTPAPTTLASPGRGNVFVARFGAAAGTCAWAVQTSGGGATGNSVAVDAGGNALVTGGFTGTTNFGSLALVGPAALVTTGFLAVLGGAGTLPTRAPAPGPAFTLFPNPARNACQIQGTAAGAAVILYDVLGRPLARALADASGTARLALPDGLAPGLYLVRCGGQVQRMAVE